MVNAFDDLPDIRDGLTRKERISLDCLNEIKQERGDRNIAIADYLQELIWISY